MRTEAQKKIGEMPGITEDDLLQQLSAQELTEDAYLIAEYTRILIEFYNGGESLIYKLLKKKIERDGWSEEYQNLLDIYLSAGRITKAQYFELTLIGD